MMVDEQLAGRGITDGRVLEAMGSVPRELFVTDRDRRKRLRDMPLRIGFGQTISQPYMVAVICQAAEVHEGDRVLDIGTGSGTRRPSSRSSARRCTPSSASRSLASARTGAPGRGRLRERHRPRRGRVARAPRARALRRDRRCGCGAGHAANRSTKQLRERGRLVVPVGGQEGQRLEVIVRSPEGPAVARSVRLPLRSARRRRGLLVPPLARSSSLGRMPCGRRLTFRYTWRRSRTP